MGTEVSKNITILPVSHGMNRGIEMRLASPRTVPSEKCWWQRRVRPFQKDRDATGCRQKGPPPQAYSKKAGGSLVHRYLISCTEGESGRVDSDRD